MKNYRTTEKIFVFFSCVFVLSGFLFLAGCNQEPQNRVVLYCSVDDIYARPLIAELEKKTGLKIDALYDVEAAKTAGLANRIRAEKNRPRGDVFWSSALLQTLLLQREGLLLEYSPPAAKEIPSAFKDARGAWTGVGMRRREIVFNKKLRRPPRALSDLLRPNLKNQIAISNPQFGTGSDWVAALAVRQGQKPTLDYFRALKKNGVRVVPGNGVVAERIAKGDLLAGVTDTDDFLAQQKNSFAIRLAAPRPPLAINAVEVPGCVAILKGAPHSANAQKLVDALASREFEAQLIAKMKGVTSLRDIKNPPPADTHKWADAWLQIRDPLADILLMP
jgi:iron(III) transport system substrate-binding protein